MVSGVLGDAPSAEFFDVQEDAPQGDFGVVD
jgi:hypothetical protein